MLRGIKLAIPGSAVKCFTTEANPLTGNVWHADSGYMGQSVTGCSLTIVLSVYTCLLLLNEMAFNKKKRICLDLYVLCNFYE